LSLRDNQITLQENIACVIAGPRQSSSRRDRQNGHPDCRCVLIQIVALQRTATRRQINGSMNLISTRRVAMASVGEAVIPQCDPASLRLPEQQFVEPVGGMAFRQGVNDHPIHDCLCPGDHEQGPQAQSSLYVFFFGFRFVARRAQPAIPEELLKSFGKSAGVTFVKAANSKALDHLLFCFGSKAEKVTSINVLAGLIPFLCGMLKYSAT
jgi:hypothetical protein